MTMTRETKAQHTSQLATARATGFTAVTFQSPALLLPAKAERGHARMTAAEYRTHKMHRSPMDVSRLDRTIEIRRTAKLRHRRTRPARVA